MCGEVVKVYVHCHCQYELQTEVNDKYRDQDNVVLRLVLEVTNCVSQVVPSARRLPPMVAME